MYGVLFGTIAILIHLSHLRSIGVPYLAPITPTVWRDWKNVFWLSPLYNHPYRSILVENNRRRLKKAAPVPRDPRRQEE